MNIRVQPLPRDCSLIVSSQAALQPAEIAWTRFEATVPDHPLRDWRCGPPTFSLEEAPFIAQGALCYDDERGTLGAIALSKEFFFKYSEGEQTLTLLHEAIHVALFAGECKEWYIESRKLGDEFCHHPSELENNTLRPLIDPYAEQAALMLFQLKHEIAAEKFLQQRYPSLGLDRAEFYQTMQEDSERSRDDRKIPVELRPFDLLYRLLCAELSQRIARGRLDGRPGLLVDQYRVELLASSKPELLKMVPSLLNVDVNPAKADRSAYRSIFDEAVRAKPPNLSDWADWRP